MSYLLNAKVHVLKNGKERVTSDYGERIHPIKKIKTFHYGIDLIPKDYVIAFEQGTVKAIRNSVSGYSTANSAGNYVLLEHDNGYVTKYYHLKQNTLLVAKGDTVTKGETIAYVGATGEATGAHLHFAIYQDGQAVDPKPFLLGEKSILDGTALYYQTGKYICTSCTFLNVRTGPGLDYPTKTYAELTVDAKKQINKYSCKPKDGYVRGVVFNVSTIANDKWGKTPSGWVCLDYSSRV